MSSLWLISHLVDQQPGSTCQFLKTSRAFESVWSQSFYIGPCYWLSDSHSFSEPQLPYQLTWMITMINCDLRADTVSRGEEEPKMGTDGTLKPGLSTEP